MSFKRVDPLLIEAVRVVAQVTDLQLSTWCVGNQLIGIPGWCIDVYPKARRDMLPVHWSDVCARAKTEGKRPGLMHLLRNRWQFTCISPFSDSRSFSWDNSHTLPLADWWIFCGPGERPVDKF